MELADILSEGSVIFCDKVENKTELLEKLAQCASRVTGHPGAALYRALADREALGSTGLGNGIAIPHGKIEGLTKVTAVFARLAEPVNFESVDDQPVDLVVMLLAPVGSGADHLKALARVARLLRTDELVAALRASVDPAELYMILTAPLSAQHAA